MPGGAPATWKGPMLVLAILLGGCATRPFEQPPGLDVDLLRQRAETVVENDVRVSATIPSREELDAIFGIELSSRGIQPVWLEIENRSERRFNFLRTGLDPEYFSPREVAFAFYGSLSEEGRRDLDRHLERLSFENPVDPHSTVSGFVFANEDRETKFVGVDLVGRGWSAHLSLLVPLPDRSLSEGHVARIEAVVSESEPVRVDEESELRTLLEKLPCCAADAHGNQAGPLNLVLVGDMEVVGPALVRRHFRYTPMSPLYVFGRAQDLSGRKSDRWVAAQPHALRLWITNIRFQQKPVWIGQIITPLGGRFANTDKAPFVIDPDVDAARIDLVQDAIYSQLVSEIGFVVGAGAVSRSSPRMLPGGSRYHTDGLRAVMIFDGDPVSISEIGFLGWESLADHEGK